MKRQFQLTEEEVRKFEDAQYQAKDGATRTRYLAVRLYGTGYPVKEVLYITGYTRGSLMNWRRSFDAQGIDGLRDKRIGGNRARLKQPQMEEIQERLHSYTPVQLFGKDTASHEGRFWTTHDLARALEQWYGVTYRSHGSYVKILTQCGLSYQRPAQVYKSRSEAKVVDFESHLEKN